MADLAVKIAEVTCRLTRRWSAQRAMLLLVVFGAQGVRSFHCIFLAAKAYWRQCWPGRSVVSRNDQGRALFDFGVVYTSDCR